MNVPARPLHRIAAVARATGVSEHLLRMWERRYGGLSTHRSTGGYRLFSDDDVDRVRVLKSLVDRGFAIGDVATLSEGELAALGRASTAEATGARPNEATREAVCAHVLAAIERLDAQEAERALAAAAATMSPFDLAHHIVAPLLHEVGRRWASGALSVAHEHAASAVVRSVLGDVLRSARGGARGSRMLATTPPEEHHELGALLAAVVAADAGAHVVFLGARTPVDEIVRAASETHADVVLVSIVDVPKTLARAFVQRARQALPRHVGLWIGGASAVASKREGVVVMGDLPSLRDRVRARN
jgi:DNA-binding transcriptional MerR regulator/methylmalonyl-CoA mutase cobalamin-binding subunit